MITVQSGWGGVGVGEQGVGGASETGVLLSGGGVGGRADGLAVPLGAAHHLRLRPGTKINQHIVTYLKSTVEVKDRSSHLQGSHSVLKRLEGRRVPAERERGREGGELKTIQISSAMTTQHNTTQSLRRTNRL